MDAMTLYVGACRYYLGRATYAVTDFCEGLIADWPALPADAREVIARDVECAFSLDGLDRENGGRGTLGHAMDRKCWEKVRKLWTP